MTRLQYWGGWAIALALFWTAGYFVIKWAVIAAAKHIRLYL